MDNQSVRSTRCFSLMFLFERIVFSNARGHYAQFSRKAASPRYLFWYSIFSFVTRCGGAAKLGKHLFYEFNIAGPSLLCLLAHFFQCLAATPILTNYFLNHSVHLCFFCAWKPFTLAFLRIESRKSFRLARAVLLVKSPKVHLFV